MIMTAISFIDSTHSPILVSSDFVNTFACVRVSNSEVRVKRRQKSEDRDTKEKLRTNSNTFYVHTHARAYRGKEKK